MHYFDLRTGALVDSLEFSGEVENRLAQSYPIVPVSGRALDIIAKGREALKLKDNELGPLGGVGPVERPKAKESPKEALKAVLDEQKAREKAAAAPVARPPAAESGTTDDVLVRRDGEKTAKKTGKKVTSRSRKR